MNADPTIVAAVEDFAERGRQQFSHWNESRFREYWQNVLPILAKPGARSETLLAYAELVREAVGRGYLVSGVHSNPANLMEQCLRDWLPKQLAAAAAPVEHLAETWNLLEGLMREPRWVNAYVLARARELEREASLRTFLVKCLQPLFEVPPHANWSGPFRTTTLSTRPAIEDFLPGEMKLAAPNILSVRDRRRDVSLGIILRRGGGSELIGVFEETDPYADTPSAAIPRWQGNVLTVIGERIELKHVREPFRWIQTSAGFVVASAADSQKLWIVESAS